MNVNPFLLRVLRSFLYSPVWIRKSLDPRRSLFQRMIRTKTLKEIAPRFGGPSAAKDNPVESFQVSLHSAMWRRPVARSIVGERFLLLSRLCGREEWSGSGVAVITGHFPLFHPARAGQEAFQNCVFGSPPRENEVGRSLPPTPPPVSLALPRRDCGPFRRLVFIVPSRGVC